MSPGSLKRTAMLCLLGVTLCVVRIGWSSRNEWVQGEQALARRGYSEAVTHYGQAARLYLPASPWVEHSLRRLRELAVDAQAQGNATSALIAWRELRSAVLATRSFYLPHRDVLNEANIRIAELSAAREISRQESTPTELLERTRWHAERLARDDAPSVAWSLLALLALAGWIGATIAFIYRGLDDELRLRPRPALLLALTIGASFFVFLLALRRA